MAKKKKKTKKIESNNSVYAERKRRRKTKQQKKKLSLPLRSYSKNDNVYYFFISSKQIGTVKTKLVKKKRKRQLSIKFVPRVVVVVSAN